MSPVGPYALRLGRMAFVTALGGVTEATGDGLEAVGATLVAAEAKARPFTLKLPVHGDDRAVEWQARGMRMRRQVRALMENPAARLMGLYLAADFDPDLNCWLLVGGGDLAYTDAGPTFADFTLELSDCYRVGSLRTHREARRVQLYDRRDGSIPKDLLRRVYGAVYSGMTPLPLIYLPPGATDIIGYNGRRPLTGAVPVATGTCPVVADAASAEAVSFERPPSRFGEGDVVAYARNGAGGLVAAGHSITAGDGLPAPATDCWPAQLRVIWPNVPYRNIAVGGSVSCWDSAVFPGHNGWADCLQRITRPSWSALFLGQPHGPRDAHVLQWGINDLDMLGSANPTPSIEAHRTVICRARQSVWCEHNDSSISFGTGWTTVTGTAYNSGPAFRTCNASGRTVTITVPDAYQGTPLDLLYILNGAATDAASVAVSVTGATTLSATHTLSASTQCITGANASRNGITRRLTGLNPGAHTITLTFNSVAGTPGFNGWGVEAADPPRVVLPNTPRQPNYAIQAYFGIPYVPTDASFAPWNAALDQLALEFADGRVITVDIDSAFAKRPELFQVDAMHFSLAGATLAAQLVAAAVSPDEIYGPDQQVPQDDVPSIENGRCRVRFDTTGGLLPAGTATIVPGFAVDTNQAGTWVEAGKLFLQRGFLQDCRLVGANVVEATPERVTVKATLTTTPLDPDSREEVYVTLARGWPGPRFEAYGRGSGPVLTCSWSYPAQATTDAVCKINAGGGAAIVSTAPAGSPWGTNALGAMSGENHLALYRLGPNATQLRVAVLQPAATATTVSDYTAYGASMSTLSVGGFAGNYLGVQLGTAGLLTDLLMDAEAMTLGAGTTNTAVAGSNGGNAARGTRTTDANAHVTRATWPNNRKLRARVFARVKTSASTLNVYAKTTGTGGTTGSTATTTSTSYVWLDLGEVRCVAGTLEIHAWAAAAATFDVDLIQAFRMEDRTDTAPTFDGARDLGASMLYDAQAIPALVERA